jgi:uncharacterized protein YpuA (DUF1002 family)
MQFQSMTGLFPGVPWNAYQAGQVSGPLAQLLTSMTESGNLDLNSAGGVEAFIREAGEMEIPPDQAMAAVANLQNVSSGATPPGPPADVVEEIFPGGVEEAPETPDEVLDVFIRSTRIPELLNQLGPVQAALMEVDPTNAEFGARSAQFNALREEIAQLHQALGGDEALRRDIAFRYLRGLGGTMRTPR